MSILCVMYIFQKLINAETAIYDVLQDFFWHSNPLLRMAALEVNAITRTPGYNTLVY